MPYNIVDQAIKVGVLNEEIDDLAKKMGKSAFAEAYRRGAENYKKLLRDLADSEPAFEGEDRRALRVYVVAEEYMETKRTLAINLLTWPNSAALVISETAAVAVIRSVGTNRPLLADRLLLPLVALSLDQFEDFNMSFSYLTDSKLHDLSWDEFHASYSTSGYIDGLIVARTLVSPVSLPPAIAETLSEMRMCIAFGQTIAVHALCRTLLEVAFNDVNVRIGAEEKLDPDKDQFFYGHSARERISRVFQGGARGEALDVYKATSRVIHAVTAPEDMRKLVQLTIDLVERLYEQHALEIRKRERKA